MIPLCIDQGIGIIPWSPLARGFLAGNRKRDADNTPRAEEDRKSHRLYNSNADWEIVERAVALGEKLGVSSAQVAIAWMLHKPGLTSPIVGATKMQHLDEAIAAVDIALSVDEMDYLEEPYVPKIVQW
jgi:aryl-alcohol dehydrogenase (NADP+)